MYTFKRQGLQIIIVIFYSFLYLNIYEKLKYHFSPSTDGLYFLGFYV